MHVPLMLVVGGREQEEATVNLRRRHTREQRSLSVEALAQEMLDEVAQRA
jgi:threonyl-tRNA synthetase